MNPIEWSHMSDQIYWAVHLRVLQPLQANQLRRPLQSQSFFSSNFPSKSI